MSHLTWVTQQRKLIRAGGAKCATLTDILALGMWLSNTKRVGVLSMISYKGFILILFLIWASVVKIRNQETLLDLFHQDHFSTESNIWVAKWGASSLCQMEKPTSVCQFFSSTLGWLKCNEGLFASRWKLTGHSFCSLSPSGQIESAKEGEITSEKKLRRQFIDAAMLPE